MSFGNIIIWSTDSMPIKYFVKRTDTVLCSFCDLVSLDGKLIRS